MQKREVLADGQIEVGWDVTRKRVEVRVVVSNREVPHPRLAGLVRSDPVFEWAWWSLIDNIEEMIRAQLLVIPHYLGEQFDTDPDTGETERFRNTANLLALLENSSRQEFGTLLRAPDVVDAVFELLMSQDRVGLKGLQAILRQQTAGRRGAPRKDADERRDVLTAEAVDEVERAIAEPFEFAKALRRQRRRSIPSLLMAKFTNADWRVAEILAESKTRRHASYRIVAERDGRSVEAVKRAALRGVKHLNSAGTE